MDTNKQVLAELWDRGVLACLGEVMVACLYEGMVACLDNNNNDDFDVYIRHSLDECSEKSCHTPWIIYSRKPWVYHV